MESAVSMIKRKFGDSVRSKTPVAMENGVLAKIVAHNVVVLVHEMYELGIDPDFGSTPRPEPEPKLDEDSPRLLRFPGA